MFVGAQAVQKVEGNTDALERRSRRRARRVGPTGVGDQGVHARVPQEPGRPRRLRMEGPAAAAGAVPLNEGNEVTREG